jgi:hypothetical protein
MKRVRFLVFPLFALPLTLNSGLQLPSLSALTVCPWYWLLVPAVAQGGLVTAAQPMDIRELNGKGFVSWPQTQPC